MEDETGSPFPGLERDNVDVRADQLGQVPIDISAKRMGEADLHE